MCYSHMFCRNCLEIILLMLFLSIFVGIVCALDAEPQTIKNRQTISFPKRLYSKVCLENKEVIVIRDNVIFNIDSNGKPIHCEGKKK